MIVREMKRRDMGAIVEIWTQLMAEGERADPRFRMGDPEVMRSHMMQWFEMFAPFPPAFIAVEDGRMIGWISCRPTVISAAVQAPQTARIGDLWVHPEHRRQGIATELLEKVVVRTRAAGFPWLDVGTLANDAQAMAFWKSQGFTDWRVTLQREA